VVPNIRMREDEEFLFEDNPTEYIQRDMEVRRGRFVCRGYQRRRLPAC
jgi:hypothetical protein